MVTINQAINSILDSGVKAHNIADRLNVSEALISTWKNKDNDFVPRLPIAREIYKIFNIEVYPYHIDALRDI